jgi:TolA-binding protein
MRNRIECFCDLRKDEPVKTLTIMEIMAQSYVGRLEQQNKDLKQQLTSAKEEISSHLEALEVSKDWHSNQKKELLDKIQRLESEVEQLRKQETQQTAQIEIKETKK